MSSFNVFLAYNSTDKPAVERLAKKLRDEWGLRVWFDKWNVRPGLPWQELMEEGIRASRSGAVLVGKDGIGPWEAREMTALLNLAVENNLPVIPVLLPGAPEKPELPLFLNNHTWVDLRNGLNKDGLAQLVWGITGESPHDRRSDSDHDGPSEPSPPISADLKTEIAHLPQPGRHFVGREDELALLDKAWLDPGTNVVEFVAFGGVGKSALVAEWIRWMRADGWRGAVRIFGHSFYSQGSREDAQASADSFLEQALRFFGDPKPEEGSPWDKGERLARLVREQPSLLVLDGVEPLQAPPTSPDPGALRDPGLAALVRELAAGQTAGSHSLCVISSRTSIQDIEWLESGPDRRGSVMRVQLETLSDDSGAVLLEQLGVHGTPEQMRQASKDVHGHGLALTLLGNYLREFAGGDVEARHNIGLLDEDLDAEQGGHARRMMQELERWLAGEIAGRPGKSGEVTFERPEIRKTGQIALEILRLTGLFDRPITAGEFAALINGIDTPSEEKAHTMARRNNEDEDDGLRDSMPLCETGPIPGLTDSAGTASEVVINAAIRRLVTYGLITKATSSPIRLDVPLWPDPAGSQVVLDAHPLIREYFAGRLQNEGGTTNDVDSSFIFPPSSIQEAHRRLYEHLKQSASDLPDSLNDLMPLYHAVAHGCKAALHQDAFEMYLARIHRQTSVASTNRDQSQTGVRHYFGWVKFGRNTLELRTLGGFFEQRWSIPSPNLQSGTMTKLLPLVGYALRAIGRNSDARKVLRAAFKRHRQESDDRAAARALAELSDHSRTTGDVAGAVREAVRSIELADRSPNVNEQKLRRATLATALHQAGRSSDAEQAFRDVESREPPTVAMHSRRGFHFRCVRLDLAVQNAPDSIQDRIRSLGREEDVGREHGYETTLSSLKGILKDARKASRINVERDDTLAAALGKTLELRLMLGISRLAREPLPQDCESCITRVVDEFRSLDDLTYKPAGLLARAAFWRFRIETTGEGSAVRNAKRDLSEAERIAKRGSMLIWQIEATLERTRLYVTLASVPFRPYQVQEGNTEAQRTPSDWLEQAREKLGEVKWLVTQTEKPYKSPVHDWDDWKQPEYVRVFNEGDIVGYHCRKHEIERLDRLLQDAGS